MTNDEHTDTDHQTDSGTSLRSGVAGGCAQAITGLLENVRDRLRDKRDFYRRSKNLDSVGREKMAAAENAMDNAIVIVERFLSTYREEHE